MKYPQMTLACTVDSVDIRALLLTRLQAKYIGFPMFRLAQGKSTGLGATNSLCILYISI